MKKKARFEDFRIGQHIWLDQNEPNEYVIVDVRDDKVFYQLVGTSLPNINYFFNKSQLSFLGVQVDNGQMELL